jgi:hypothetical protein
VLKPLIAPSARIRRRSYREGQSRCVYVNSGDDDLVVFGASGFQWLVARCSLCSDEDFDVVRSI